MLILLVASSDAPSTLDRAYGFAEAAVGRGHGVMAFFHMDGVRLLKASQAADCFGSLVPLGVRLLVCRTSAKERGLESEGNLMEGVVMSSLSELVEMLERCDRALFFG